MGPIARDAAEQSKNKAVIEIDPLWTYNWVMMGEQMTTKREKAQLERVTKNYILMVIFVRIEIPLNLCPRTIKEDSRDRRA